MTLKISFTTAALLWSGRDSAIAFQSPSSSSALFRSQQQQQQHNHLSSTGLNVASMAPPAGAAVNGLVVDARRLPQEPQTPERPEQSESTTSKSFDWFKSWHPLVPVEFLDAEKPHAFKLLGMDIVVWNDGPLDSDPAFRSRKERAKGAKKAEGKWRAFVDECPHRRVPLSEGRIEDDGSLLCSYHAWRFDGEGEAIDVPQISEVELEKVKANPKSNCNSFPVEISDGILWVWPDAGADARIESALSPVPNNDYNGENIPEDRLWKGSWNFRELPYGHDYFIENVVDSAHVPVSHHNVVGDRYADQSMTINKLRPLTKDGFGIGVRTAMGNNTESYTTFHAPSQVLIESPFGERGAAQYLELYSSPSRPGFTNHVGRMVIVKDETKEMPNMFKQFTLPLPTWVNHVMASAFLNQDALFLHGQERSLARNGVYRSAQPEGADDSYAKAMMPTSADKGVMLFRTWMSKFANGFIPFKGDTTMPPADNEAVFDVWNAHTKNCKYCLTALRRLKKARVLTFMASAIVATVRPKMLGLVGSTVATLGLSGFGLALTKLIRMFYRYEFSHAENH